VIALGLVLADVAEVAVVDLDAVARAERALVQVELAALEHVARVDVVVAALVIEVTVDRSHR
jgi:hypothetical protein